MATMKVSQSHAANRVWLVVHCTYCGHECLEPLNRLQSQNRIVCRECATPFELKAKDNKIFIEKLVEVCASIDAGLA